MLSDKKTGRKRAKNRLVLHAQLLIIKSIAPGNLPLEFNEAIFPLGFLHEFLNMNCLLVQNGPQNMEAFWTGWAHLNSKC